MKKLLLTIPIWSQLLFLFLVHSFIAIYLMPYSLYISISISLGILIRYSVRFSKKATPKSPTFFQPKPWRKLLFLLLLLLAAFVSVWLSKGNQQQLFRGILIGTLCLLGVVPLEKYDQYLSQLRT
ncbi:hypothetical protein ACHBIF_00440 [Streptococcus sp. A11]|uniref:hypothetical protein n=1 Tax=unclassified Streptococcus TaxID=2608887 RepID=UPI0037053CC8